MSVRSATCSCGQLRVTCEGEPVRISMCHCLACQKRTGSIFGVQARFPRGCVKIEGLHNAFERIADSGNRVTTHFCPGCGSTIFWELQVAPDLIAVAIGAFADPSFPDPKHSVFENMRHRWALHPDALPMEHL